MGAYSIFNPPPDSPAVAKMKERTAERHYQETFKTVLASLENPSDFTTLELHGLSVAATCGVTF